MKNYVNILILFCLFLIPNCKKETVEINTMKQPEGKGVLKQIITVSSMNSNEAQTITNYEYFDNGKLKKTSYSHSDGIILAYSDYIYNNENQLEEVIRYSANSSDGYINITIHKCEYLANGLKSKETIHHPVIGTSEYLTFEYKNRQNMTKKTSYNSNNQIINYVTYDYDEFDNILIETSYSNTNEQTGETIHYYQNNMLYKSDVYILGKDRVHLEQILKSYDDNYNLIMLQSNILWLASSRSSSVLKYIY